MHEIDIVQGHLAGLELDGRRVLEVNAMPGWRTLAKACDMDVTRRVLAHVGRVKAGCRVER